MYRVSDGATVEAYAKTIAANGFKSSPSQTATGIDNYEFLLRSNCEECVAQFHVVASADLYASASGWPQTCDEATGEASVACAASGDLQFGPIDAGAA